MSAQRHDFANGDRCPVVPEHGKMFFLSTGTQYCAHHDHDKSRAPAVYEFDGVTPRRRPKEQPVAFRLPDSMKSALDPVPAKAAPRVRVVRHDDSGLPPEARADAPKVCRAPKVGNSLGICANCDRVLVPSQIRKSGVEHAK